MPPSVKTARSGSTTGPDSREKIWMSGEVTAMSSAERSVKRTVFLPASASEPPALSFSRSPRISEPSLLVSVRLPVGFAIEASIGTDARPAVPKVRLPAVETLWAPAALNSTSSAALTATPAAALVFSPPNSTAPPVSDVCCASDRSAR